MCALRTHIKQYFSVKACQELDSSLIRCFFQFCSHAKRELGSAGKKQIYICLMCILRTHIKQYFSVKACQELDSGLIWCFFQFCSHAKRELGSAGKKQIYICLMCVLRTHIKQYFSIKACQELDSSLIRCFFQFCSHAKRELGPAGKKQIYIYICIYDKWNYHLDKATPTPFLYCYYYYICLFGWLRSIGEVSRSDTSD